MYKYFPLPLSGKYLTLFIFHSCQMKEEILQTSLQQFLHYNIRKVSIQKLVEPLGISTKTVYKYFANKEQLLEEALYLLYKQSFKEWEKRLATYNTVALFFDLWYSGIEIEYNVNKIFYQDLRYYYPALHEQYEALLTKKYKKQLIQIIQRGIAEDLFLHGIITEVIFEAISVLFKAIAREGQFNQFKTTSFDILLNTIAVMIRGFCTPKGLQLLEAHIQHLTKMRVKEKAAAIHV